ncbi:hypothetical protein MPER_12076 [Moniliophthora perniciosa FA553]|nr:hypothetical protein MPER_12076 [Moniliophthora perniciosa FA553]
MRFSAASAAVALSYTAGVLAADISVEVGQGGLTFTPPSVNATQGDNIIFSFVSKNHTVTQSTFAAPCTKMDNAVDSGYQSVSDSPINWTLPVNNSDTLWFYCAQTQPANHCQMGMVFAINAPTEGNNTFENFQNSARGGSDGSTNSSGSASGPNPPAETGGNTGVAGLALGLTL